MSRLGSEGWWFMMGPNFSPVIAFKSERVIAMGPLGQDRVKKDNVEEIRAWIYQPVTLTVPVPATGTTAATELLLWSPDDAAATDTETGDPSTSDLFQAPGVCWMLPLKTITASPFQPGRAFAVAVALISDGSGAARDAGHKRGRVIWWGHPIWLSSNADAFALAEKLLVDDQYKANPGQYFDQLTQDLRSDYLATVN
jgi:hypothetical protein